VIADLIALRTGGYVVTEAGFGADMGAERFFNIKCRTSGEAPDAAVVVATVRALKAHSGKYRIVAGKPLPAELLAESPDDVHAGAANLVKQIENMRLHGVSPVVAVNTFPTDHASEHAAIREIAEGAGARCAVSSHFTDGGRGAAELAEAVAEAADEPSEFRLLYPDEASLRDKIETIATKVYGADGVEYSGQAARQIDTYEKAGFGRLPICMAKTHLSLSSDPTLKGAPTGWTLPVREVRASVGAGFVYPICGDMRTMPGLGSDPAAAHAVLAGRLTTALQHSGFGPQSAVAPSRPGPAKSPTKTTPKTPIKRTDSKAGKADTDKTQRRCETVRAAAERAVEAAEQALQTAADAVQAAEDAADDLEHRQQELDSRITELQRSLTQAEEEVPGVRRAARRAQRDQDRARQARERAERALSQARASLRNGSEQT